MTRHWLREWGTHASAVLWNDLPWGRHRHCRRFRALEGLEDRILPSTLLVSNPGDHGSGTLRDAIQRADLNPGSTINFSITGTITLSSALPDLIENVTITGPGASVLTVQRSSAAGTPQFSVFAVDVGVMAAISGLTIAGGNVRTGGGAIEAGDNTGDVAYPVPQGAMPWEHFVIGLDDDFDQVRREFLEQPLDEDESKREGEGTPSPLDDPIALWSPADLALDRWERGMSADLWSTDHHVATDEVIYSQWSKDAASCHPLRSGSWKIASPVRVVPASSDTVRDVSTSSDPVRRGGESSLQLPDPEGTRPLQVSLSRVALALVASRAWPRRQRRDRPE